MKRQCESMSMLFVRRGMSSAAKFLFTDTNVSMNASLRLGGVKRLTSELLPWLMY